MQHLFQSFNKKAKKGFWKQRQHCCLSRGCWGSVWSSPFPRNPFGNWWLRCCNPREGWASHMRFNRSWLSFKPRSFQPLRYWTFLFLYVVLIYLTSDATAAFHVMEGREQYWYLSYKCPTPQTRHFIVLLGSAPLAVIIFIAVTPVTPPLC